MSPWSRRMGEIEHPVEMGIFADEKAIKSSVKSSVRHSSVLAAFLLSVFCTLGITLGVHSLSHEHRLHLEQSCRPADSNALIGESYSSICVLDVFVNNSFDDFTYSFHLTDPFTPYTEEVSFSDPYIPSFCGHSPALRAPPFVS